MSDKRLDLSDFFTGIIRPILKTKKLVITINILLLILIFFWPKEYESTTTFLPQNNEGSPGLGALGNLGSLANVAGLDLSGGLESSITSRLYPELIQNLDLQYRLINSKIKVKEVTDSVTYKEYYLNHYRNNLEENLLDYTIGLPSKIIGLFSKASKENIDDPSRNIILSEGSSYMISREDLEVIRRVLSQAIIDVNARNGLVVAGFKTGDPLISSQMTVHLMSILKEKLTDYESAKAKRDFLYIQNLYKTKQKEFYDIQVRLAEFRDANQALFGNKSQLELQNLQTEYAIISAVYQQIATDLEQAKVKLEQDKPFFYLIQEVKVPQKATNSISSRMITTEAIFVLVVFLVASLIYFVKPILKEIKLEDL